MPQLLLPPALTYANLYLPETCTGTLLGALHAVAELAGRRHRSQHHACALPLVSTPQFELVPELTCANRIPPDTATGELLLPPPPFPSSPFPFEPQQYAAWAVVTPQL